MTDTERAITAYNSGILSQTIVIYPKGKRTARLMGKGIRLYLGNRLWQRGATDTPALAKADTHSRRRKRNV